MPEVIGRRQFLRRSGIACAGTLTLGRSSRRLWAGDIPTHDVLRKLAPVHVDSHLELRTIVGLRPYRPSGFVVRAEKLDEILVVHNYGHGGAGITLSWGTAQLALDLALNGHAGPVAVLGSGAVGLATARLLQEAGLAVTIYTATPPEETTSYIAGGEWFPFLVADPDKASAEFNQQLLTASELAYKRYQSMLGPQYGIRQIADYSVSKHAFTKTAVQGNPNSASPESASPNSASSDSASPDSASPGPGPIVRDLHPAQTPFPPSGFVRQIDTMLIEPPRYLRAMTDAFLEAGGKVVVRKIEDRGAIERLPEKLVFNCTGMGAKDIFGDDELTPVRGQVTFLKPQPEVDYAVAHDELYMLPRTDGIVLGGTYELGVHSTIPDANKKAEILARHKAFFDSYRRIGS